MLVGTIDYRDGWLCLKYVSPKFDVPELMTEWWGIERVFPGDRETLDLTGAYAAMSGRTVSFRMGTGPSAAWARDRVVPNQPAVAVEVVPLPCPRVRKGIETRYRRGRWEKYLQTRGWVPA